MKTFKYTTGEPIEVGDDTQFSSGAIVSITKITPKTVFFIWHMDDSRGQLAIEKFIKNTQLLGKNQYV
jgi:hypothetical protein